MQNRYLQNVSSRGSRVGRKARPLILVLSVYSLTSVFFRFCYNCFSLHHNTKRTSDFWKKNCKILSLDFKLLWLWKSDGDCARLLIYWILAAFQRRSTYWPVLTSNRFERKLWIERERHLYIGWPLLNQFLLYSYLNIFVSAYFFWCYIQFDN